MYPYTENDILPFLEQVMNDIRKYKYCCHIYTKKSILIDFGDNWRNYLLNNLLGNSHIISEILTEFENNKKLGFIYPETFYKAFTIENTNKIDLYSYQINLLLNEMFPNYKILKNYYDSPEEVDMFWAKTNAIHKIFTKKIIIRIKNENKNFNNAIQNYIKRIWIYIVKLNGYYHKKIFKHI